MTARRFVSRWMEPDQAPRLAYQNHWLQWLAGLSVLSMAGVVLRVWHGGDTLLWLVLGLALSSGLARAIASIQFHGRLAVVDVEGSVFRIRTMHDLAFRPQDAGQPFPLSFAAPQRLTSGLQIHYLDRVLVLYASDWPEFTALEHSLTHPPVETSPDPDLD